MIDSTDLSAAGPAASVTSKTAPALTRPGLVLLVSLALGFVIEALLHGPSFGIGYALAALVVCAGWLVLGRGLGLRINRSTWFLLACFVAVSLPVALRASDRLRVLDVLLGLGLTLLIAVVSLPGGLPRMNIGEYVVGLIVSSVAAVAQPFVYLVTDARRLRPGRAGPGHAAAPGRTVAPVLWGVLLALPLLLIFGALLTSADPVFASYLHQLFAWNLDIGSALGRLIGSLILAWLALGLARYAFLARTTWDVKLTRPADSYLGEVQAITVLAMLDLLFAAFVLVQAAYLFGGLDTMARAGLTHSEYARRGFFELVTVAALVLTLVLALDWLVRPGTGRSRRCVDYLNTLLIALTLVILISALYRMRLYVIEYGLTELRLYTTVFMGWLALVLLLLAAVLLAGPHVLRLPLGLALDRRHFTFLALAAGLGVWLIVNIISPDALIVRTNLARGAGPAAAAGGTLPICMDARSSRSSLPDSRLAGCLDAEYLTGLSADAMPALLAGIGQLPDRCAQATLARMLQAKGQRLERERQGQDWRGATISELNARRLLQDAGPDLTLYAAACTAR
jgi:hypothetical protein